jgi:hypothetical protein
VKVIRLPSGLLRVPVAVNAQDSDADATEDIGPADPRYPEYSLIALSEEEHRARARAGEQVNAELLIRWNTWYETQGGQAQAGGEAPPGQTAQPGPAAS